jgi:hypothetical protein
LAEISRREGFPARRLRRVLSWILNIAAARRWLNFLLNFIAWIARIILSSRESNSRSGCCDIVRSSRKRCGLGRGAAFACRSRYANNDFLLGPTVSNCTFCSVAPNQKLKKILHPHHVDVLISFNTYLTLYSLWYVLLLLVIYLHGCVVFARPVGLSA